MWLSVWTEHMLRFRIFISTDSVEFLLTFASLAVKTVDALSLHPSALTGFYQLGPSWQQKQGHMSSLTKEVCGRASQNKHLCGCSPRSFFALMRWTCWWNLDLDLVQIKIRFYQETALYESCHSWKGHLKKLTFADTFCHNCMNIKRHQCRQKSDRHLAGGLKNMSTCFFMQTLVSLGQRIACCDVSSGCLAYLQMPKLNGRD